MSRLASLTRSKSTAMARGVLKSSSIAARKSASHFSTLPNSAASAGGILLSLGAAAAFGAYGVINQPLTARYPGRELMAYTLGVGGVLIFLTGGGTIVSKDVQAVDFKAGDCVLIPAAFEGAARFDRDTEYLTVTM